MNVFNKGKYVDSGNAFSFSAQKLIPRVFTRILLIYLYVYSEILASPLTIALLFNISA